MPSVAPKYTIVGRPGLPAIGLGSITAGVERSMPPSFETQLPLTSCLPARMREISVCFSAVVRFEPSVAPRFVAAFVVVALTFVVVKSTIGGKRPACSVVNTVRQLPLNLVAQPATVAAGMPLAASNTLPSALIAVREVLSVVQFAPVHAVKLLTGIARM